MRLRDLVGGLAGARVEGDPAIDVERIVGDSRACRPGDAFVAMRGEHVDGHEFVAQAYGRGAAVAVVERAAAFPAGRAQVVVADSRRAASHIAARFFDEPSAAMRVVGITGTNGKTTTSYLVRAVLEAAGERCAVIGTLGVDFGGELQPLANTTPPAIELQEILARVRAQGARAASMEVSSHALALDRVDDVRFDVAVLTNVTRDHLDFHGSFEAYVAAKRRLFDLAPVAVLNADDAAGLQIAQALRAAGRAVVTYGVETDADVRAADLTLRTGGSTFRAAGQTVELALPGRFNVANALAALGVASALDVALPLAASALAGVRSVPGRMERFSADGVDVIVDYAHTPDALANVLRSVRESTRGRLFAVFGCGGDRDAGKRPEMGAVAAALADVVIVTSDNPRSEDPLAIAQAVAAPAGATIVLDRRSAIRRAIDEAHAGDVVVVAGKGHEAYQIVGDERRPFDDREEVRTALRARGVLAS